MREKEDERLKERMRGNQSTCRVKGKSTGKSQIEPFLSIIYENGSEKQGSYERERIRQRKREGEKQEERREERGRKRKKEKEKILKE